MAKKPIKKLRLKARAVTLERAGRLYHLLSILSAGPQTRAAIMKRLRLDVRGFYRDLKLLRSSGISVPLTKGRYRVDASLRELLPRLPFPDPGLTLGEAMQLSKGKHRAHSKLREQIARILR